MKNKKKKPEREEKNLSNEKLAAIEERYKEHWKRKVIMVYGSDGTFRLLTDFETLLKEIKRIRNEQP